MVAGRPLVIFSHLIYTWSVRSKGYASSSGDARPRHRRILKMILVALAVLIVVFAGVVAGGYFYLKSELTSGVHKVAVPSLLPLPASKDSDQLQPSKGFSRPLPSYTGEDVLVVGTERLSVAKEMGNSLGVVKLPSYRQVAVLVMALHYVPGHEGASVLEIPANLLVAREHGNPPELLGDSLAKGPGSLVRVVENGLGVPLNHYLAVSLPSLANLTGRFGGIKVNFPYPMQSGISGRESYPEGCIQLNGEQILSLVNLTEARVEIGTTWSPDPLGAASLIRIQRSVLSAIAKRIGDSLISDPFSALSAVTDLAKTVTVDRGFSVTSAISQAKKLGSASRGESHMVIFPTRPAPGAFANLAQLSEPRRDAKAVQSFLQGRPDPASISDHSILPQPRSC
ncbi:MAG: LCP family protein [Actinobacteria bacterium]|nr:LCP family protein [Actinomycetota bacterium]